MFFEIYYTAYLIYGFVVMFLFYKFRDHKKPYYITAAIGIVIILSVLDLKGESIGYLFDSNHYPEMPLWSYIVFQVLIILPTMYFIYPFAKLFLTILYYLGVAYDSIDELVDDVDKTGVTKSNEDTVASEKNNPTNQNKNN